MFAVNSLLYLNQSQPPYGVSLNSITSVSTEFLLKVQDGVRITLDCVHAVFVSSDKLVLSLRGGELYVLTLMVDGMRVVRSFHLDKAAASVLTSCVCTCGDGLLFLGSRLGNSLLLRYTEKLPEDLSNESGLVDEEPVSKKRKLAAADWLDLSSLDDLDELEVYGTSVAQSDYQLTQYTFEVCDSLLNIGPCAQMVMGEPAFLSEEFHSNDGHDLELVTTSGYGKNGALTVLQRRIRPQVVTTFELPGCVNMWTVVGYDSSEQSELDSSEQTHMFLILSREDSSMVLKTGQEIMELDQSGLNTREPTVFAGNVGSNRYVVQVCARGVRLLDGVKQLQHIPLDVGSPIISCSLADPYVVVMTEDSQVIMLVLKPDTHGTGARLVVVTKPSVPLSPRITTLCCFSDESRTFTLTHSSERTESVSTQPTSMLESIVASVEDEDELLYGESLASKITSSQSYSHSDGTHYREPELKLSYWLAVCRDTGTLEIYTLPDLRLCYSVNNFPNGEHVLTDSVEYLDEQMDVKLGKYQETNYAVEELLFVCLGGRRLPFIMARINEDLLIYESFVYHTPNTSGIRLQVRFKKIIHGLLLGNRKPPTAQTKGEARLDSAADWRSGVPWLRPFDDISGYSGVFVCGPSPHWVMMTSRGMLRVHPMSVDGPVTCFTAFHNVNCPKGFLYFNRHGELRICVLPTHLSYDAAWPVRKVTSLSLLHYIFTTTEPV